MANTRAIVFKLLKKIEKDKAYSNIVLDKVLSENEMTAQEKRFVSALFYGVIERKITLDAVINSLSKIKSNKLDTDVLIILRMGIYQLLYMNSVPDSASVNESVKLAKKCKNPALSGFVNGVLRSFIRNEKRLPESKNEIDNLSVLYSCPVWLIKKWDKEYGRDVTLSMLKSSIGKAPVTVRFNNLRMNDTDIINVLESDDFSVEKTKLEGCYKISGGVAVENSKAYKLGLIFVQDISSQLSSLSLDAQENETILDLCASPGGKTFTTAIKMNNTGKVLSFDLHESRVKLISNGASRLGLKNVIASQNDACVYNEKLPMADRILCDVPCSGLGVIRRKPEIKYKNPDEFNNLPEIQYKILETSAKYLKSGGILVYSTCTLSKAENEDVVEKFLKEHPNFIGVSVNKNYKELSDNCATILPDYFNCDGFFIAKFQRV